MTDTGNYTVNDIINAMKRCAARHIIVDRDREALTVFDERTWIQLAIAAMVVAAGRKSSNVLQ